MSSELKCPVQIVNTLAVSGFLNGVTNLVFTTAQWLPKMADGQITGVDIAEVPTVNLRMDLVCAKQVHEALGKIIEQSTKPEKMDS